LANTTYYAQWSYATWIITFDANGGIPLSPNTETINQGSDLSTGNLIVRGAPPQPLWSDSTKIFDGWFDTTTEGTQISESTVPAGVTTYYAHWVTAITVTTSAASSVTDTSANLNGGIVGTLDTAFFCFDDQIFDSSIASTNPDACSGATAEPLTAAPTPATYSFNVSGLTANTTYYFMQVGSQVGNIIAGSLLTFTTTATPAPATPTPSPAVPVLMSPTITWSNPAPQVGPYTLGGGQLNAVCSIPGGTLSYVPAVGSKLFTGTHNLKVTCTPPAGSAYQPLTTSVELVINSDAHVTVAVEPASAPQAEVVGYNSSNIWWAASPNADGYYVTIGGVTACTTTALSCKVAKLIGPKSQIAIYATLAGATSTPVVPTLVKPSKPQVIGIIYFDTAKYNVCADQQPEINQVARLLLQLGYTDVNISGHTDTNPFDNITLSNNRALTLKKALGNLVPGLSVNLHYYGATDPMADNGTVSGQAKNRRAEISVW
jgi:outer membrane protein OmpA-like peptidoglycan-associated protein